MFSRFFGKKESTQDVVTQQQPEFPNGAKPIVDAHPNPQLAYEQLQSNPQDFLSKNIVNIRGQWRAPSGQMDFVMVSRGQHSKRRSSFDGSDVPVYRYDIMSRRDFNNTQLKDDPKVTYHSFSAEHVAMEKVNPGDLRKRQQDPPSKRVYTEGKVRRQRAQTFVTNAVSACSIVRLGKGISHWQPQTANPNNPKQRHNLPYKGPNLEQGIKDMVPHAAVYGPSTYRGYGVFGTTETNTPTTQLFIQSPEDSSSVHLWAQQSKEDEYGYWHSHVAHHLMNDTLPKLPPRKRQPKQDFVPFSGQGHRLGRGSNTYRAKDRLLSILKQRDRIQPRGTPLGRRNSV